MITRRDFLIQTGQWSLLGGTLQIPPAFSRDWTRQAPAARYWISAASPQAACSSCHAEVPKSDPGYHRRRPATVQCLLCARNCVLRPGERGRCRARINIDGRLRSLVYGRPAAIHVDPIEKKPFYHFLPGSDALSLATTGCPLQCQFCQNWQISQASPEDIDTEYTPAAEIVRRAEARSAPIIAFTYNEPTVFLEYLADIAAAAAQQKRRSVLVSCGFMNAAPLEEMCRILSAIKIDLKGFSPDFYRSVCGADLQPVLDSIRRIARSGVHMEIVNLVVPTLNDAPAMMTGLVRWILGEVGPDVPLHFTRFHPDYRMRHLPATPVATLERFRDYARSEGMRYVYVGNVPRHPGNHTYCPRCGKAIILRRSIFVEQLHLKDGNCAFCGAGIPGVWA